MRLYSYVKIQFIRVSQIDIERGLISIQDWFYNCLSEIISSTDPGERDCYPHRSWGKAAGIRSEYSLDSSRSVVNIVDIQDRSSKHVALAVVV